MLKVSEPLDCSFTRYLEAKKSVDDRALNRHVLGTLMKHLPESNLEKPLKVLEIGAGIGGMIDRMMDWGILNYADYTAVDFQSANKAHAFRWLRCQSHYTAGLGLVLRAAPDHPRAGRGG